MKYRVEIFQDNHWRKWSSHQKPENAFFIAKNLHRSRNCDVRVVYKGEIVRSYYMGD